MSIIQQLEDLKEWSKDSTRYERRLAFRGHMPSTEAGTIPPEWDELSDREQEYYRTGPWSTREDYRKGQLVQPGPEGVRQGYSEKSNVERKQKIKEAQEKGLVYDEKTKKMRKAKKLGMPERPATQAFREWLTKVVRNREFDFTSEMDLVKQSGASRSIVQRVLKEKPFLNLQSDFAKKIVEKREIINSKPFKNFIRTQTDQKWSDVSKMPIDYEKGKLSISKYLDAFNTYQHKTKTLPKGQWITQAELVNLIGKNYINYETFAHSRAGDRPGYIYQYIKKLLNEQSISERRSPAGATKLHYFNKPTATQIEQIRTFVDSPLLNKNTIKAMQVFDEAFVDNFTGKGKNFPTLDEARAVLKNEGIKATDSQMARAMMRLGQAYQGRTFKNEVPIQVNKIGGNFIFNSFNEFEMFHPWRSASYNAAMDDITRNMPKEAGSLSSFKNTYRTFMKNKFPEIKGLDLNEVFSITTSANQKSYPYAYFVDLTNSAINRKQLSAFQGKASLAEGKIIDNIKKYRKTGDVKYYNEAIRVKNLFNNKTRKNFLSSEKIKKAGGVNALELELGTKPQILNKSNIAKDYYAKNTLNKWKDLGIDIAGHSADAGYVKLGATQKGTMPIQELFTPESRLSGKKVMVASTLDKFLKANGVNICG